MTRLLLPHSFCAWLVLLGGLTAAVAQDRQKPAVGNPTAKAKGDSAKSDARNADRGPDGLASKKADKKGSRRIPLGPLPEFTPENEAAALRFVGEHHRELSGLLERLKTSSSDEYERAVRELFRTSEKLAQTKSQDGERYDIELETWKSESEIRLLAAKLTMGDSQELKGKLRNQLVRKNKLQLQRLELEKRRVEERLKKLDENIEKAKKDQEQLADRQMAELLHNVRKEKPAKKARPAAAVSAKDAPDKGRAGPNRGKADSVAP